MAKHDLVVALDIGTTKTCCLIGEIDPAGKIEILGRGISPSQGLKKGIVVNIEEAVHSVEKAVLEAERMAGFDICSVYITVNGDYITSLNYSNHLKIGNSEREITEVDLKKIIEQSKKSELFQGKEILHFIPKSFLVDGHNGIVNPVGMVGNKLEMEAHIVTALNTILQNIKKCIKLTDLEIEDKGTVLHSLASSTAILTKEEKELGSILIDLGGGITSFVIFKHNFLSHSGILSIGGNHITYDLAIALRLSIQEAERIKITYGSVNPGLIEDEQIEVNSLVQNNKIFVSKKYLMEIIEARVGEIFSLINDQIEDLKEKGIYLTNVVLSGGGALLPGILPFSQNILKLPVRIGLPSLLTGLPESYRSPIYNTAIGLLLYAVSQNNHKIYKNKSYNNNYFKKLINWLQEIF